MENITAVLIFLSLGENFLMSVLVYSFLFLKIMNKKFFILVLLLTSITLTVRSFPVTPLIISLFIILTFVLFLKYIYNISKLVGIIVSGVSLLIYMFVENIIIPTLGNLLNLSYPDVIGNPKTRFFFFLFQVLIMSIIIITVRYFKVDLRDFINFFDFENLRLLADDEIDLGREKRVTVTFYLVIVFLLFQGLFINFNILGKDVLDYFNKHDFFNSPYFVNTFIIILNLILLYLLHHLIRVLRMERNDIVKRIKDKNSLRLDWEKRAQMHDRNHHLSMLYMLIQVNQVDKAKEYLKGMVGEIQNVEARVRSGNPALNALIRSKIALGKQSKVRVVFSVLSELKGMCVCDWDLNRIIGNLLDNAIEAVEDIDVDESERVVELLIEGEEEYNRIEVITYGIVISDQAEAHIFEKGYSSKEERGHGLGLAICKELVDEYNGQITIIKDQKQVYTSFKVLLPVCK